MGAAGSVARGCWAGAVPGVAAWAAAGAAGAGKVGAGGMLHDMRDQRAGIARAHEPHHLRLRLRPHRRHRLSCAAAAGMRAVIPNLSWRGLWRREPPRSPGVVQGCGRGSDARRTRAITASP